MIQLITNSKTINDNSNIKQSLFNNFEDLNSFDINIIDLSDEKIWKYKGERNNDIECSNDLQSIKKAINKTSNKVLIILPQNVEYFYNYGYSGLGNEKQYNSRKYLKDMIPDLIRILRDNLFDLDNISIQYGKTNSIINNKALYSDFSFINYLENEKIIIAKNKKSVTTVLKDNVAITSLKIEKEEDIIDVLSCIFPDCFESKSEIPEWVNDIDFYTDKECKKIIHDIDKKIEDLNNEKDKNMKIIEENKIAKSILYETGDVLATEVNKILYEMLEYDEKFKDEYEEDGIIKLPDITFIIETKGLNNEVKRENVHKASGHLMVYRDKLDENGIEENTKALFVVAYQRNIKPDERGKVDKGQLAIAKQNDTLIIDTRTLLKIYEDFKLKIVDKDKIVDLFKSSVGELKYEKANKEVE